MTKWVKTDDLDRVNTRNVLRMIELEEGLSRAQVARKLNLSRTTISTIVSKLISLGFVTEKSSKATGRGRPGIHLNLTTNYWYAIGVEFHSKKWVSVVTDLEGRILRILETPVKEEDAASFLLGLKEAILAIRRHLPGPMLPAIGVGAPGLVDCEKGVILRADDFGWRQVEVKQYVEEELGLRTFVLNRHRAGGLAESRFGVGRKVHNLVYIGIGTGISAAFISDGILIHGANYAAGEIGHMIVDPGGTKCGCGKNGCLQAVASGTALVRMAKEALARGEASTLREGMKENGEELSGELICREAAKGDPLSRRCVEHAAKFLGIAVANIINSFNPDRVIIGGPIGQLGDPLVSSIRKEAEKWSMEHPFSAVQIVQGSLGDTVGALGAACLVLDRKLELVYAE
ncbi:MAG: ROK family transcriptional regulator [Spirochaetales bacterium]